ncbi:IQ motif and SEC7 domain-containing protein 1 isoform X3 [Periplaneta americana]|uniref:IQ motif and SEC7 domain-containing protein 1 isoform X3 n=1 Tax=Periplaneta americana TaxID=6978 RepID=UPI0037E700FD
MSDKTKPGLSLVFESEEQLQKSLENNVAIIHRQCQEIEDLKHELDAVTTERDMLLCEVSKLKFEMEIADLKRLHDGCSGEILESRSAADLQMNGQLVAVRDSYLQTSERSPCSLGNRGQGLHKKGSIRESGDVLKRSRVQTAYELSQDLLEKQIEMLERKYGGVKARNAALTIQRAFRRYTLLKKFAAITAMAKAEKRLSRRLHASHESHASTRPLPLRSMSMRERRNVDSIPLPRSQSSRCDMAHVNVQLDYYTPTSLAPCPSYNGPKHFWDTTHYYTPQEAFSESGERKDNTSFGHDSSLSRDSALRRTIATSPLHQNNVAWNRQDAWTPKPGTPQRPWCQGQKIPPEVPKRTSSISSRSTDTRPLRANGLNKTRENGSLSSVQSSGSDSSLSADRVTCESLEDSSHRCSPIWKRKGQSSSPDHQEISSEPSGKELSRSHTSAAYQLPLQDHVEAQGQHSMYKVSETVRKRQYRVGLNLFNKKPERGIAYLIRRGFLENSPQGVARFLISRKGLSKQMIGEYLGNLQNPFNMAVLECFSQELDLSGMQVDVALRKFQTYFRMPGEAQKIERLMEVFGQRYCQCDRDVVAGFRSPDTVFVLAFAIIMLNTDLHTPNLKPERRMKLEDFIKNLRGIDDGADIDRDILVGIYERVKANEFKPGSDHVTQVMKVQSTIVGKKPNMALPHRRLVCYCRLYEIPDIYKKERPGVHQREVFLFNDLLVITKILSKKKSSVTYTFRQSFPLCGMIVALFEVPHYQYGIRLSQRVDNKVLVTFNARNEHDRCKFAEDLRESISEMDEMENLRIDAELERQKSGRGGRSSAENRDSGVADVEVCPCVQSGLGGCDTDGYPEGDRERHVPDTVLKRSALSNSLLDIHEQCDKPQRRGSMGSLDSGMSISFQSTVSHESSSPQNVQSLSNTKGTKQMIHQQSFLGGLFAKRERKASRAEEPNPFSRSTDV